MPATLMIVGDDADVRTITKLMLERKGYNVHAFGNGPQA
jgi:CheY-like chemotaxis protein